jgi:hypothetical protein
MHNITERSREESRISKIILDSKEAMEGIVLGNIGAKVPHAEAVTIKCDLKNIVPKKPRNRTRPE